MKRLPVIAWLAAVAALTFSSDAWAQNRAAYEKMITIHANANHVPEALVHRVIVRESKYHPDLIGRGGTIGLMQIKLQTARGLGYTGDADGLRNPDTNLAYGIKYLAGAYRAAEGNHDRAVRLYASGYYDVAKRQRLERARNPERQPEPVFASAPPKDAELPKEAAAEPKEPVAEPREVAAAPVEAVKPEDSAPEPAEKPKEAIKPREVVARPKAHSSKPKPLPGPLILTPILAKLKSAFTPSPKPHSRKLAEAKERVPHPAASVSGGANATKPR
jgi:Transglycosylase SLT domain